MSTAAALLDSLVQQGVELKAEGDKLLFRPTGRVPAELKAALREHKPEILALLRRDEEISLALAAAYRRYWTLPETEPIEVFQAAYGEIETLEGQASPEIAWRTLREAATAYHTETGICPFCRERGGLHLPAEQPETELLGSR